MQTVTVYAMKKKSVVARMKRPAITVLVLPMMMALALMLRQDTIVKVLVFWIPMATVFATSLKSRVAMRFLRPILQDIR